MKTRLAAALADRYRLVRELGQCGMATVYLAEDLKHERRVAVKGLKPELAAVIGAARVLTEIRTTANPQHPHIPPLFYIGTADGFLFTRQVVSRSPDGPADRIVIVQNFFTELGSKVH